MSINQIPHGKDTFLEFLELVQFSDASFTDDAFESEHHEEPVEVDYLLDCVEWDDMTLPSFECDLLDIPKGSSYGDAVRAIRGIRENAPQSERDIRVGLTLSEKTNQQFIEQAGGERRRSEWLAETLEKLSSGYELRQPDNVVSLLERIEARLILLEQRIERMERGR